MAVLDFGCGSFISSGEVTLGRNDGDHIVVRLRGEHDIATVRTLSESMAAAVALAENDVWVDLSGVEFIGLASVEVLLQTRDHLRLEARDLALRSPSARAKRLLDLCGLPYAS